MKVLMGEEEAYEEEAWQLWYARGLQAVSKEKKNKQNIIMVLS